MARPWTMPMNIVVDAATSRSAGTSPCCHGGLQQLRQQLAVALQQQAELALERRIGGLLQVVKDQARHARAFADELDVGGEDPGEGVERGTG